MEQWTDLIVAIFVGLATAIPLIIELVKYVKAAIKEKNWNVILNLVIQYMQVAEEKFESGAERKEWVLEMVKESAKTVDYDLDLTAISNLIDQLCNMSKLVNTKK